MEQRSYRKTRQGVVVSDKLNKTITIEEKVRKKHPLYGKVMQKNVRYYVHDETNDAHLGDTVEIMETRPLSAMKRWRLVRIVERAK